MTHFFRQTGYFRHNQRNRTGQCGAVIVWASLAVLVYAEQNGQNSRVGQPSTDGAGLLAKALRQLPQAEAWTASFRQQWLTPGITALVDGSYTVGPNRRARIEFRAQLADTRAELIVYCDGQTIWRQERIADQGASLVRYSLEDLERAIREANLSEAEASRLREALWGEHGYQSVRGRLRELASRFQWKTPQADRLPDGRPAWLLEGTWNEKTLQEAFRGQLPQAAELPRRCRVYLLRQDTWWSGDSLWPARIEWLGLPRGEKEEKVLAVLEWTSPRRIEPDAPELRSPFRPEEMAQAASGDATKVVEEMVQRSR